MKILIVGANGRTGRLMVLEAMNNREKEEEMKLRTVGLTLGVMLLAAPVLAATIYSNVDNEQFYFSYAIAGQTGLDDL